MAVVVSQGQLMGLEKPSLPRGSNVRLDLNYTADYATIWRTQPHVRTVVSFLARNIAQIGLHTFERTSDTDRRRLNPTDHPLAALIMKPNARTTRYRLIDALVNDLGIYDVACWVKVGKGSVDGLVRLPSSQIEPLGDSWAWPEGIRFKGNRGHKDFTAEQVVLFRGYNPSDSRWGVSPMETLRQILAEEYQATRYREQLWRNGARFPGHIERPKDAPWTPAARERFRADWRGLYTGEGPGAGGTPVLEDGMKFVGNGITPAQAQYLETRKLTREEVAAAFHIPLPMVGILDHATFSNIEEQHKNLYQDTLGPWLEMIQQEIGLQLVPDFDDSGKVYVEFNLAEKMKGSFEEQAGSLQTSVGAPWLTRNEARARMNLPQIDGGDDLVVPLNVLTGGQASPTDSGTQNETPKSAPMDPVARELTKARRVVAKAATDAQRRKIAEVLERFFDRQGKAVLSRIGAREDWWDGKRWDDELTDDLTKASHAIAAILGANEADRLGFSDGYDPDMTVNFLRKVAADRAAGINATTKAELDQAIEDDEADPAVVFETARNSRADKAAESVATFVGGFAAVEAARQIARSEGVEPTKTWRTGSNPRASHARMDGETVPVGEKFSNGMDWPGQGDADDAGCNCSVEVNIQ